MNELTDVVGLSGVAGVLPSRSLGLDELAGAGLLTSAPQTLCAFGFTRAYISDSDYPIHEMALDAARAALSDAGLQPHEVDLLVCAGARPEAHVRPCQAGVSSVDTAVMQGFRYTSAWLQDALDLHNASVTAVAQQGCTTMLGALRVARALLLSEPGRRHALCVGLDALPSGAPRELLYNVISDAACAVVVSRGCRQERWIGCTQLSHGHYWDPAVRGPEIIASYFPTAKGVIETLLDQCGLRPADVDVVVPTGVNQASWDILLRMVGIPADRLHRNLPSFGHTITADSFLYLQELRRRGDVPRGSRVLLFTYGFGSSWCALLLEH